MTRDVALIVVLVLGVLRCDIASDAGDCDATDAPDSQWLLQAKVKADADLGTSTLMVTEAKHRNEMQRMKEEAGSTIENMKYLLDADSRLASVKVRYGYPLPQKIHANHSQPEDYSVCLTSTPKRVGSIEPMVESIMNQKPFPPSRVILSVPDEISRLTSNQKLNEADLDWTSQDKYRNRLVLHRVRNHDFGPATKVLGCLEVIPEDTDTCLVVTDDDMQRPQHWVQLLLHKHSCVVGNTRVAGGFEDGPDGMRDMVHGYRGWAIHRSLLSFDRLRSYWSAHRDFCYFVDDEMFNCYLHKNCLAIDTLYSTDGRIPTAAEIVSNDKMHNDAEHFALSASFLTGGAYMAHRCSEKCSMDSGSTCGHT